MTVPITYTLDHDGVPVFLKTPQATLDFEQSFATWLAVYGDTLATATFTVEAGLTKVDEAMDAGDGSATVWLSGGEHGETFSVLCEITTVANRDDARMMRVLVENR